MCLLEDRAPDSIRLDRRAARLPHAVGWGRRRASEGVPYRSGRGPYASVSPERLMRSVSPLANSHWMPCS